MKMYNSFFDMNGRLSPKSILSIFQGMASYHAEEIGVGFDIMMGLNLYWVLSRVKFDIIKMPKLNQDVIVHTWPHEKGRIDFDRDFKITSEDGEVLIIGTSKWCVIDAITRSLQRTDKINYVGEVCGDVNYEEKFGKISLPEGERKYKYSYIVRFSDLDVNKHMNNTNYANLVLNAVEYTNFSHFEINYLNECTLGDEISLSIIVDGDKEYVVGENGGKIAFTALIY